MSVELECTMPGCDLTECYGLYGEGGGGAAAEGEGGARLVRPSIARGCTQGEFEIFKMAFVNFVMASDEDDELISNKLVSCLDRELRMTLIHTLGDRSGTISIVDMLEEIGQLVVPFGQNGPNSARISCFGPKKEKFHYFF